MEPFVALRMTALVCLLTFRLSPVAGQTAVRKSDFEQLRDSLATISNTGALRALQQTLSPSAPLRAGVVGLRLGELRADPTYSQALSSFRRAARIDPGRPEPWYGLGLAEAGRSQWEMEDRLRLGNRVGLGGLERSATDYARALEADLRFLPAALSLAQVELALLDSARLPIARDLLRRVAEAGSPAAPELFLALGRVERAAGTLEPAIAAFESYLVTGPNRGLGLLELARTRLALGRADGEAPYYEGAALDDPVAIAGYRADLGLLVADSVLRGFDRLRGASRAAYLYGFWADRDHFELRPEGARLQEHYRRVLFARANFPLTISRRFYGRQDAYRSGNAELDDRGVIYIRHGKPTQRLRPFVFGAMPNESWLYARSEGDLLFHFSAGYDANGGGDLYDYRLVQSVLDLRGASDAPGDQLLLSRQSLSPIYSRMLNWGKFGSARAMALERSIGAADIAVGTTSDSYELQFAHPLGAVADLVAVGRSGSSSLAHFVFGITAPGASGQPVAGKMNYPVRIRLVVLDRDDRAIATLDTAMVISRPRPLTDKEWLVGRAELTLPPGRWTYRAALQQGDSAGVVLPRDSVLVSPTESPALALSDIALGSRGGAARWVSDAADTVLLSPGRLFRRGTEVQVYYEVSGAKAGQVYRHQITVLRADGREEPARRRPLVSLSFDEGSGGEVIRSRRSVQLDRLKPGNYFVEVRVAAPDGSFQVRRRSMRLTNR
jgi:GWxTD domain-containing protein